LKKQNTVIAGYYGFGNAGDELILYALVQKIRRDDPEAVITVLSADPPGTAQSFGIRAVDRRRPWQWIPSLIEADRFILGGGGLLQESTGPWNYFYYLTLLVVAKMFGCTTDIISIGVDPIVKPWNRFWTRFVLHHWTDHVTVRDEVSRRALTESGVHCRIDIARDPVLELSASAPPENRVGMALAVSRLDSESQWAQKIAAFCNRLAETECRPIDLLVLFPAEDEALAREVAHLSSAVHNVRVCNNPLDLLTWIPQYRIIGGTRFHALVVAAVNQIPFFGWGTQNKAISLCKEFNRPFWVPNNVWDLASQAKVIQALYQSPNKSVILAD
jgi:polysaccharide pyruvyl transferase CsaB